VTEPQAVVAAPQQEPPYADIADALLDGLVTPFLGAGVNVFGRERGSWVHGSTECIPDGGELAQYLADRFEYRGDVADLARVSQFAALSKTELALYSALHNVFTAEYRPNLLHGFFGRFQPLILEQGRRAHYQLIVTTNYDDALEDAFTEAGEDYDVFVYRSEDGDIGRFWHRKPDGTESPVLDATNYPVSLLEERSAILKIHGAVKRNARTPAEDSYVITEDDYIEYLAHTDISTLVPSALIAQMRMSHFLFLGYSMRDWNLRAFLHRVWSKRPVGAATWSIQLDPDPLEVLFWQKRGVEIFDMRLETFIDELARTLAARLASDGR